MIVIPILEFMMVTMFLAALCAVMLVFPGHGGRQIVDFMEEGLERNVRTELQTTDSASTSEKLARAFLITDMQSRQLDKNTAGATAVVGLIRSVKKPVDNQLERTLYIGNVGDSRAVLVCEKHDEAL